MGGVSLVFLLRGSTFDSSMAAAANETGVSLFQAAILCVLGAFFNRICSVITEATLKQMMLQEEQEQEHHDVLEESMPP